MPEDNILIVEDDAILAIHLEDVLTRQGYSVLKPVATGEDAIKVVKNLHPGLILMDIELGGKINGITAAERIGEIDDTPNRLPDRVFTRPASAASQDHCAIRLSGQTRTRTRACGHY